MSQWCVFPISWHLNILGNYVITRYYRVFGVVFTEIYRIIWKKNSQQKLSFIESNAVAYLFVSSICKYTNATCVTDIYVYSFNIEQKMILFTIPSDGLITVFIVYPNYL